MELAIYLWPAHAPRIFELTQANLLYLSLAQPLCNSCHIPSHILFVFFLLTSRSFLILHKGLFLFARNRHAKIFLGDIILRKHGEEITPWLPNRASSKLECPNYSSGSGSLTAALVTQ